MTCLFCCFQLPLWHEKDLLHVHTQSTIRSRESSQPALSLCFQSRHAMLFICLLRHAHVLGNVITDWDCVVDAFDQLCLRMKATDGNGITEKDLSFLCAVVKRFPAFTTSLEEESLVRLMTSLVALSTNSLVTEQRQFSSHVNDSDSFITDLNDVIHCIDSCASPQYLSRGLLERTISFPFKCAVDIAKENSFRVSSIWQMMMSHIRVMAAVKVRRVISCSTFSIHVHALTESKCSISRACFFVRYHAFCCERIESETKDQFKRFRAVAKRKRMLRK